jgi:glyoxylase-like metal-dependent hydrolase (beta-lactamase superfamily II)
VVIDPGSKEQSDICEYIQRESLHLDYIILTHEHFDHCWGVNYLLQYFDAKVVSSKLCEEWVTTPMNYFNKLYYDSDEMYSINHVDLLVEEVNMCLKWHNQEIQFIEAKGHSNKGICVVIGPALFSGDTMIYNTKPFLKKKYGASVEELYHTIFSIFSKFDIETMVYPGHGVKFLLNEMTQFYNDYFTKMGYGRIL